MKIRLIGIDLAKTIFQICGVNQAGKKVFNRQVRRNKLLEFLMKYPDSIIAMEACSGSNHWGRELKRLGFNVMLIPPQHVKPFVKGNKNDRNDAFAITEAANRPDMHTVQPRSLEQTDLMLIHKILHRKTSNRTALINQTRGLLQEYGIVIAQGKQRLRDAIPELLEDAENGLTDAARQVISALAEEWRYLNESIIELEKSIKAQAKSSEAATRLMKIKGVGEKISTAAVAIIGDGKGLKNGRHCAANLGVVPKEHSSGGKQKLGGITKRGNRYLRYLLIQGAWSIIRHTDKSNDRITRWARGVIERRGKQKAAVAIANKLARIIWSMLRHNTEYQPA